MCMVEVLRVFTEVMGNKTSCCSYSASPDKGSITGDDCVNSDDLSGNLQHISEREPEDWNSDPSLHPKARTMFLERFRIESKFRYCFLNIMILFVFNNIYYT